MPCMICDNQVSRHFFAGSHGSIIVQLCKEHQKAHGPLREITPANPTCTSGQGCPQFGKCCKTRSAEGTL